MLSKGLFVGFSCHVTLFLSNSGGEDQGPDSKEAGLKCNQYSYWLASCHVNLILSNSGGEDQGATWVKNGGLECNL